MMQPKICPMRPAADGGGGEGAGVIQKAKLRVLQPWPSTAAADVAETLSA
jgi:hypothetical protein